MGLRFTDEQLSRILTAHEAGGLTGHVSPGLAYPVCPWNAAHEWGGSGHDGSQWAGMIAHWAGMRYEKEWSTDRLLAELEALGVA